MLTLERNITVPADRRVFFDLPRTVPAGKTRVFLVFPAAGSRPAADAAEEREAAADDEVDGTAFINRDPAYRDHILRAIDEVKRGGKLISVPAEMFQAVDAALATG